MFIVQRTLMAVGCGVKWDRVYGNGRGVVGGNLLWD